MDPESQSFRTWSLGDSVEGKAGTVPTLLPPCPFLFSPALASPIPPSQNHLPSLPGWEASEDLGGGTPLFVWPGAPSSELSPLWAAVSSSVTMQEQSLLPTTLVCP